MPADMLPFAVVDRWEQLPEGVVHRDVADVAVLADEVFLLTRDDASVIVLDRDGTFVRRWGMNDLSARPHGLTAGASGKLWVADEEDHAVSQYTPEGELVLTIGGAASDTGYRHAPGPLRQRLDTIMRAAGPFNRPTKVAEAPSGDIYVTDGYGNARVHQFTANGDHVRSWGAPGTGVGEFHLPHAIVATDDGRLIVADRENERLQIFGMEGQFIQEWRDVQRPCALAIDPVSRNVLVGELTWLPGDHSYKTGTIPAFAPARLSLFSQNGDLRGRWCQPVDRAAMGNEASGMATGSIIAPHGMAFDSTGRIYVAEVNHTFCAGHGRNLDAERFRAIGAYDLNASYPKT